MLVNISLICVQFRMFCLLLKTSFPNYVRLYYKRVMCNKNCVVLQSACAIKLFLLTFDSHYFLEVYIRHDLEPIRISVRTSQSVNKNSYYYKIITYSDSCMGLMKSPAYLQISSVGLRSCNIHQTPCSIIITRATYCISNHLTL